MILAFSSRKLAACTIYIGSINQNECYKKQPRSVHVVKLDRWRGSSCWHILYVKQLRWWRKCVTKMLTPLCNGRRIIVPIRFAKLCYLHGNTHEKSTKCSRTRCHWTEIWIASKFEADQTGRNSVISIIFRQEYFFDKLMLDIFEIHKPTSKERRD